MDPLMVAAARQGGVFTLAQALAHHDRAAVRREVRAGRWHALRRGIYATDDVVRAARREPRAEHMLACAALVLASEGLVVSHRSAALAQGIPLLTTYDGPPDATRPRPDRTPPRHLNGLRTAHLPADQRTRGAVPITTAPRTVADCLRTLPREDALALADAALRLNVPRADVLEVLATCRGWPGVRQAQELLALGDGRAESGLESVGRLWCHDAGLPAPDLQLRIGGLDGRLIGRVDLVWLAQRTVAELDGRLKYVVKEGGPRPDEVLWLEKRREDDLRDAGFEVARGYWSDRGSGGRAFVQRVRRAMARGSARADVPSYRVLPGR